MHCLQLLTKLYLYCFENVYQYHMDENFYLCKIFTFTLKPQNGFSLDQTTKNHIPYYGSKMLQMYCT